MTRLGIIVNLETCNDLRSCMAACKREHGTFIGSHPVDVRTALDEGFPHPNTYFVPLLCQHCGRPSCVPACAHGVLEKRADGIVAVGGTGACASCEGKPCVRACPYGAIDLDPLTGRIAKCDLCAERVDAGLEPACVGECLTGSWFFGDFDDPDSLVSSILASWEGYAHRLKPEAGNDPGVHYLLHSKEWRGMEGLYSPAWRNGAECGEAGGCDGCRRA